MAYRAIPLLILVACRTVPDEPGYAGIRRVELRVAGME